MGKIIKLDNKSETSEFALYAKFEADCPETIALYVRTLDNLLRATNTRFHCFGGWVSVKVALSEETPCAFMRVASEEDDLALVCMLFIDELTEALEPAFPTVSEDKAVGDAERYLNKEEYEYYVTLEGDSLQAADRCSDELLNLLKEKYGCNHHLGKYRAAVGGFTGFPYMYVRLSSCDREFATKCATAVEHLMPMLKCKFPTVNCIPMDSQAIWYFGNDNPYAPMMTVDDLSYYADAPSSITG